MGDGLAMGDDDERLTLDELLQFEGTPAASPTSAAASEASHAAAALEASHAAAASSAAPSSSKSIKDGINEIDDPAL